jgi:hypothetical protein
MYKYYRYFYQLHTIKILLYGVCVPFLINILFVFIDTILNINIIADMDGYTITIGYFFIIVIVAPFLETLIFQYAPLKIAGLFAIKYKYIYTITGISVFFGLMHVKYSIIGFFYGLILSFCCLLFIRRKQYPVFFTTLIHACYNGLLFGLTFLLNSIGS